MDIQLLDSATLRRASVRIPPNESLILTTDPKSKTGLSWQPKKNYEASSITELSPNMVHFSSHNAPRMFLSSDGTQAILQFSDILGQSSTTEFDFPGLLPHSRPIMETTYPVMVNFNGSRQTGAIKVKVNGDLAVYSDHTCAPNQWNNSGFKGVDGTVLVWITDPKN